jgi:hypothetical protein
MKKIIAFFCAASILASGAAFAHTTKKPHQHSGTEPQGGGYYGDKYHIRKKGEPKKKLLRWDGFDNPIKGMKDAQKKPPRKLPSQSTDQ